MSVLLKIGFCLVLILCLLVPEWKNEMTPCQYLGQARIIIFLGMVCLIVGSLFFLKSDLKHKSDKFYMPLNKP